MQLCTKNWILQCKSIVWAQNWYLLTEKTLFKKRFNCCSITYSSNTVILFTLEDWISKTSKLVIVGITTTFVTLLFVSKIILYENFSLILIPTCIAATSEMIDINYFWSMSSFCTPWKHQKTQRFSIISRGHKIGTLARRCLTKKLNNTWRFML